MALNPEEMKKRRQEREKERKVRQAARRRKLLLRLGIAAAVLIACGALIFFFARKENPASLEQTQPVSTQAAQSPGQTSPPLPPTTTIRVAFGGDLNVTDSLVECAVPMPNSRGRKWKPAVPSHGNIPRAY